MHVSLEVQTALTGGVGQRLDAAVIEIAAAVEHDVLDAFFLGAFGNQLADRLGGVDVGAALAALAHRFFDRRCRSDGHTLHVIDQLRIDLLRRAEHRKPRAAIGGRLDLAADRCGAPRSPVCESRHGALRYFFLPSLRKMNSPAYFTPLPL